MNLNDITTEDWTIFETKFKSAHSFLLQRSLLNEFRKLSDLAAADKPAMSNWDCERLTELKQWHKNQLSIDPLFFIV